MIDYCPSAVARLSVPLLIALALASPGPAAPQIVVNAGDTVEVPILSGSVGTLAMDEGTLSIDTAGGLAQSISATQERQ